MRMLVPAATVRIVSLIEFSYNSSNKKQISFGATGAGGIHLYRLGAAGAEAPLGFDEMTVVLE